MISVLMAAYNAERFVCEAAQSILQQSWDNLELIVVDDGSTDDTSRILAELDDPRLKVLTQDNRGLTLSLIRAAHHAAGGYLARQDADDVSDSGRLNAQVEYLETHPDVDLVGTFASTIDESGCVIGARHLETRPAIDSGRLVHENQFVHGSIMMRADAYHAAGGYRPFFRYAQDYDLVLRIAESGKVANLDREYYRHRMCADEVSIRHNTRQERYRDIARAMHRERARGGPDSIETGRAKVEDTYERDNDDDRNHVDAYRVRYVYTCLRSGRLIQARREVINRLRADPARIKPYLHLLMTFLGAGTTVRVFRLWDRMRGAGGD